MRKVIIFILAISTMFFTDCKNIATDKKENVQDELINFLDDSTSAFSRIAPLEVRGELQGVNASINFYSISEEAFRLALNRNGKNIRFFNRKFKLNENIGLENSFREDTVLELGRGIKKKRLIDLKRSLKHRAQRYFLEDKVGGLFVVKWIRFEDAGVMFLDVETMKVEFRLDGLSTSYLSESF